MVAGTRQNGINREKMWRWTSIAFLFFAIFLFRSTFSLTRRKLIGNSFTCLCLRDNIHFCLVLFSCYVALAHTYFRILSDSSGTIYGCVMCMAIKLCSFPTQTHNARIKRMKRRSFQLIRTQKFFDTKDMFRVSSSFRTCLCGRMIGMYGWSCWRWGHEGVFLLLKFGCVARF